MRPRPETAAGVDPSPSLPVPGVTGPALAQAVARLVWDALGDGIAAHLSPDASRVGLSHAVRRRYVIEAIETASRCPICSVGGHA